ncbi:hypothetical protein [uncultured Muribaculum sp.]|jgi:sugar-specific transcriptional regulator TrmB|uniref:hypothetical protein n=1 Tax=uncultured Muribaculum sp. TaxID=1918613 RepID=UPI0025AF0EE4|nr:hypothetical protein [uncultured Muribaculum sp.]
MKRTHIAQLFAQIQDAEPVKIGDIIQKPEIKAEAREALKTYENRLTAMINITPDHIREFRDLLAAPKAAAKMAENLNNMQGLWHAKMKYMPRADRRAFRRTFDVELKKFKAYCSTHGICYNIQYI